MYRNAAIYAEPLQDDFRSNIPDQVADLFELVAIQQLLPVQHRHAQVGGAGVEQGAFVAGVDVA